MPILWIEKMRLRSKRPAARKAAIERLGTKAATTQAVEPLLQCLNDSDASVRCAAVNALAEGKNDRVRQILQDSLKHTCSEVRQTAALTLAKKGHKNAIGSLVELLHDSNPKVRRAAANALNHLGWKPANHQQKAAFQVACGNLKSVALCGSAAVVPLVNGLQHDTNMVRRKIAEALEQIGDPRAVDALRAATNDPDPTVRVSVIHALGKASHEPTVQNLLEKLTGDSVAQVRIAAAQVLAKHAVPGLAARFLELLQDSHFEVRLAATEFLGRLHKPEHCPAVIPMLSDRDADVRHAAAQTLGAIGTAEAVPALVLALSDEERSVRKAAEHALQKIDSNWMDSDVARRVSQQLEALLQARPPWVRGAIGHVADRLRSPMAQTRAI